MKLEVFVVRDRGTAQFGNPMFLINRGQAIRSFSDEINGGSKENLLAKHPEDFDLFYLGTYDTDSGLFQCGAPEQIAVGKDLIVRPN